jgi:glutamate/aspartate transport system substrate-binding protein
VDDEPCAFGPRREAPEVVEQADLAGGPVHVHTRRRELVRVQVLEAHRPARELLDRAVGAVYKSGEIEKIFAKWFTSQIPPRGVNLNFQITPAIRDAFKNPNDRGVQ